MSKEIQIELPSLLSFERKLEVSDALMFSGTWQENFNEDSTEWPKIVISQRQNRSTQSAHGISDEDKAKPNPASSDSDDANLPLNADTLKVSFSLRVVGDLGKPFACNAPEFESAIFNKVDEFKSSDGLNTLAFRYAYNIANGRFLWRNRVGAEAISIHVEIAEFDQTLIFDAYDFSLKNFEKGANNQALATLTEAIAKGLAGDDESFALIKVNAYVKLGNGQHVFPSQEMNMNEKRKVLFKLDDCAAIHNVKVGNALRTIDNWYGKSSQPIAIEPFGSVTQRGEAYRKNKIDLYTLMVKWVRDENLTIDERAYVTANLIRGGVFSRSSK
nr:type I-F CRISPR-associated protein Csy3 [Pseudoalteromonas luteoviolacea]